MRSKDKNFCVFLMIVSETIDLVLDWDFIYEIYKISPEVDERHWIFLFAIWGTILYLLTLAILCVDLCDDNENPCYPWLSLLSTVTEDLPQIIFAIAVACHTKRLISWVQIAKAVYGTFEPLMRAANLFTKREKSKKTFNTASHACDMFFCFVLCACSLHLCIILSLPPK